MTKLLLHPNTQQATEQFIAKPSHALLIIGPDGSGKQMLSRSIAKQTLKLDESKFESYPYLRIIAPIKRSIGVEQIREITSFLQLKTPGASPLRRIIIIDQAHHMTTEAQNALLKSLEEPPSDTLIILTANTQELLRPTVISRCQLITVESPQLSAARKFFSNPQDAVTTAYYLSQGHAGLLARLLAGETENSLIIAIQTAKTFLKASQYERLLMSDEVVKNKEQLPQFITALLRVTAAARDQAAIKQSEATIVKAWHQRYCMLHEAEASLSHNVSPKLLLSHLSLAL